MARRRKRSARKRTSRPSLVEARLLALAREVASIAARPDPPALRRDQALARLAGAFGDDPELGSLLLSAWHRARRDERLAMTLAWAREQLRGSLQEILAAGAAIGAMRREPEPAALAWILLAGCEALLREPPGGGVVRAVDVLAALARLTEA